MGKSFFDFPLLFYLYFVTKYPYGLCYAPFLFGLCFVCVLNSSKIYTLYGKYLLNRSKFTTFAV